MVTFWTGFIVSPEPSSSPVFMAAMTGFRSVSSRLMLLLLLIVDRLKREEELTEKRLKWAVFEGVRASLEVRWVAGTPSDSG